MEVFVLWFFISGLIHTSFVWDSTNHNWLDKIFNVIFGFLFGWFIAPILLGKLIRENL